MNIFHTFFHEVENKMTKIRQTTFIILISQVDNLANLKIKSILPNDENIKTQGSKDFITIFSEIITYYCQTATHKF